MPELLQKEKKEMMSFPGLMVREKPVAVVEPPKPEAPQEEPKKKVGRPRKNAIASEGELSASKTSSKEVAPKKKGVDPKKSKVIL